LNNEKPYFSIVICTFNRKKYLQDCLDSIFSTDYPKNEYEVIIIDGGSSDGTIQLSKEYPVKFFTEHVPGLAHARNKGAELAVGSMVVYTDDDCVVDKNWLSNLKSGFQNYPSIMAAGGPVVPLHPEIIPRQLFIKPALGLLDEGSEIKQVDGLITGNLAFRRKFFGKIKFDENFRNSRKSKLLIGGEDTDFCRSIISNGGVMLYLPTAKVYHQVFVKRLRVSYVMKHAITGGVGYLKIWRKNYSKANRLWLIRMSFSGVVLQVANLRYNRSFSSCYNLVLSLSVMVSCLTCLDKVL
jgi:glucosyl-dolichyl phosphate glucuronosyltransferase